ncbi:NAD(P)H-dependent oxidoreductase [uncultured Helicobacter sp.]|uniref:NAD(P)H-dependent oxidoreductase n=1 Tax=uncultured Helicobacter sp. TaxID=175537 RepID=UPI0025892CB6|nr:NAD(P)H-dependent oxidoreductase [uncultured Helicobacter sp.]
MQYTTIQNQILEAMRFRYACKEFNGAKILQEDLEVILQAGLLAPSSFGLEHTRLLVVQDTEVKKALQEASFNQKQITTSSEVVVFVGLMSALRTPSNYIDTMIRRKTGKDEAQYQAYKKAIESKINSLSDVELIHWSLKQSYLMAQAMMDAAAFLGIDSCPMEGFDKKAVERILGIDSFREQVSLIVPFEYRKAQPTQPKIRLNYDELIKFI